MKLSIITNGDGLLTKKISFQDGKLQKQTFANIQTGTAKRVSYSTFGELRELFEGLRTDQAIVHCPHTHADDLVKLTTKAKVANGSIARTDEFFKFGTFPATFSLDYDGDERIEPDPYLELLIDVSPVFEDVGLVFMPSASGGIYKDGEIVGDSTGHRVIFGVQDASDIPRFSKALFARCWLKGLGEIKISATGALLERTIFDAAMHQPTRIDFLAGAELAPGLEQKRNIFHREGKLLDTRTLLDLTEQEQKELDQIKSRARQEKRQEAERIREQYIENRVEKLVESGTSRKDAQRIVETSIAGTLLAGDVITFDDGTKATVGELLIDPEKFANKSCFDPLEPEQGKGRAAFRWNPSKQTATIWSYLHGGQLYRLRFDFDTLTKYYDTLDENADFADLVRQSYLEPVDLERFLNLVKKKTGLTLPTIREQLQVRAGGGQGDLSHQEMAEEYLSQKPEMVFTSGSIWIATDENIWREYELAKVEVEVGRSFGSQKRCQTQAHYQQVRRQVQANVNDDRFFNDAPKGFACPSGFYSFNDDGELVREDLTLKHRARFVMQFDPIDEPPSMLIDFANECFAGAEPETQILRLQELIGVVLLGIGVDYEKAWFAFGPANSGKSTMMRVIERLIPDEFVCAVPPGDFHREYYKAMLAGKLVCFVGEGEGLVLGDDFKSMTGRDPQIGRPIYEPPFTFYPTATIILNANDPPAMQKIEPAILRRLESLTFPNSRTHIADQNIPDLDQRIIAEDQGRIMHWALEGARRVREKNVFTQCRENTKTINNWALANDNVAQFLDAVEYVEKTGNDADFSKRSEMFAVYETWCIAEGIKPMTKKKFTERMLQLGFPVKTLDGYEGFRGLINYKMDGFPKKTETPKEPY